MHMHGVVVGEEEKEAIHYVQSGGHSGPLCK